MRVIVGILVYVLACIGITVQAGSRLEVVAENDKLSASVEEMAEADVLVVTGIINEYGLKSVAQACATEGNLIRVLDMKSLSFENRHFPDDAFYITNSDKFGESSNTEISLEYLMLPRSLHTIGNRAFKNLKCNRIDFPKEIYRIGCQAFANCTLTDFGELIIHAHVSDEAFMNCPGITSVSLKNSFGFDHQLGNGVFKDCKNLQTIDFGTGITSMGADIFEGTAIEEIVLPVGVKQVSLSGMTNLREVTCHLKTPITLVGENTEVLRDIRVNIPQGGIELYKENPEWNSAKELVEDPDLDFAKLPLPMYVNLYPNMGNILSCVEINVDFYELLNPTIYLYEEGDETPLASSELEINDLVNCCLYEAFFDNIYLDESKKYALVLPYGSMIDTQTGITNDTWAFGITWNTKGVKMLVGVDKVSDNASDVGESDAIFNIHGQKINEPTSGEPYIKDGRIWLEK